MYLSRVKLDITKRDTMKALTNPNMFHGAVENCFEGERKRSLWRIDPLKENYYLLILSREYPSCDSLIRQFGCDGDEPETKDYSPLLERVKEGTAWHFRLTANPVKSSAGKTDAKGRGIVYAHSTPAFQKKWLMDRASKYGFMISENGFDIVHAQWYSFKKKYQDKDRVSLLSVVYEGILTVTDQEGFTDTLIHGIGREKAYGQGLLTVMRV